MNAIYLAPGDYVYDRLDGDNLREVDWIEGTTVHMADGGLMGLGEIAPEDVLLSSEVEG